MPVRIKDLREVEPGVYAVNLDAADVDTSGPVQVFQDAELGLAVLEMPEQPD